VRAQKRKWRGDYRIGYSAKLAEGKRQKHNRYIVLAGVTIKTPFRFINRKQNLLSEFPFMDRKHNFRNDAQMDAITHHFQEAT